MKLNALFVIFLFLINYQCLYAQEKLDVSLENTCSYYGEEIKDDVYTFNSTQEAKDIVSKIVSIVGIEQNFDIISANVPNALAMIRNNNRLILYSQNFIMNIENSTGTEWAGVSILAHEIGHHLNGHTLIPGGSRPSLELEADKFSGFVTAKLGATLQEAQVVMENYGSEMGTNTHPPRSARLEAIALGWNNANMGNIQKPQPIKVAEESNKATNLSASTEIIYTGDNYNCRLPLRITIGNKSFVPEGETYTVNGLELGLQEYNIEGEVLCPGLGNCIAKGKGSVYIRDNSNLYIRWQNVAYAQCNIWLDQGQ